MTSLVFVTQLLDPDDSVLGFVSRQLEVLDERVPDLVVIANELRGVPGRLTAETHSLGKERGAGRLSRILTYQRLLADIATRRPRPVLLAHMCPGYVLAAAPITTVRRIPTMLWYVHPADTRKLRAAERVADAVVTALPESYPRRGPTIHPIGHAIDVDGFDVGGAPSPTGLSLLAVGRTSAVKRYDTIIRAVPKVLAAGVDLSVRIVGPAVTDSERAHRGELRAMVDDLGLGTVVTIEDGVPPHEVPGLMAGASALVNSTPHGSADKVVFEAMAAALPVLTSNRVFDPLLADLAGTRFETGDHDSLADAIVELAKLGPSGRSSLGAQLRERVRAEHSLEHWADQIVRRAQLLSGASEVVES